MVKLSYAMVCVSVQLLLWVLIDSGRVLFHYALLQVQIHNSLHISNLKVELQFVVCVDQRLGMLRCVGAARAL